jgi:hypothetical protein
MFSVPTGLMRMKVVSEMYKLHASPLLGTHASQPTKRVRKSADTAR